MNSEVQQMFSGWDAIVTLADTFLASQNISHALANVRSPMLVGKVSAASHSPCRPLCMHS